MTRGQPHHLWDCPLFVHKLEVELLSRMIRELLRVNSLVTSMIRRDLNKGLYQETEVIGRKSHKPGKPVIVVCADLDLKEIHTVQKETKSKKGCMFVLAILPEEEDLFRTISSDRHVCGFSQIEQTVNTYRLCVWVCQFE